MVRVENIKSPRSGRPVANQFLIQTPEGVYFQSYRTIIAFQPLSGPIQLDANRWDCSVTTGKYRNWFLGEGVKETRKGIKEGRYVLRDLN
jgi:hypothetical protein